MENLKEIALAFCGVSVFSAAVGLLKGRNLFKSGKYIIGLVFICALISCFKDFSFSLDLTNAEAYSECDNTISISQYGAEYLVADALKRNSKNFSEISATATKNESGDIIITMITIYGADDREGVMTVLNSLGIDCRVVFG